MRRTTITLAALLLALSMLAAPAMAHDHGELPEHGHMFIHRPQIEFLADGPEGPGVYATGWRKCIDLPVTPLRGHHSSLHTGNASEGLERAGHVVVPVAPVPGVPWTDCADFAANYLPLRLDG